MRPREKLHKRGIDNISNRELFQLIIGSGQKGRSVGKIAMELEKVANARMEISKSIGLDDLKGIEGVGRAKASAIIAGIEIGRRLYDRDYHQRVKVGNSKEAAKLFDDISRREKEYLEVAFINARYELLQRETVAIGTLDQVGLHPREVLVRALKLNSFGMILAHNHPSGDATPSRSDIEATKNLKKACDIVGVKLIDHLVVTQDGWRSIKF